MISISLRSLVALGCLSIAAAPLACGPATPPPEPAHAEPPEHHDGHEHGEDHGGHEHGEDHGGHEHGEHHRLSGALHEFHEVLAPLWHAEQSPDREKKTCAAIPAFEQRAAAVDKDVPEAARADEAAYHSAAQGLVSAVAGLKAECAKADGARADFEAKFKEVHEAFHKVMERAH